MTNIHEQMLQIIQVGIDGWIAAQFGGDKQPVDSITGYPLTIETARVYYRATVPYSQIERSYLEHVGGVTEFTIQEMQAWAVYHWKYAYLELAEDFGDIQALPITEDMQARRENIRHQMFKQGYKLAGGS